MSFLQLDLPSLRPYLATPTFQALARDQKIYQEAVNKAFQASRLPDFARPAEAPASTTPAS
jgi:hypothetical protein